MPPRISRYRLVLGDVGEVVRDLLEPGSFHGCLCDPPYGLSFMGKRWDYAVPSVETWREVAGVLVPGAHLLAFAGTRTQHRMTVNIEDAGFEIRDMIAWVYGSGFPKSHNLRGEYEGYGTALKPALEPITVARKPMRSTVAANCLEYGTGALNVDGCRVGTDGGCRGAGAGAGARVYGDGLNGTFAPPVPGLGRWPANLIHDGSEEVVAGFPETKSGALSPHHRLSASENRSMAGPNQDRHPRQEFGNDSGSAARFFYCAKASRSEREAGLEGLPTARGPVMSDRCVNCGKGRMDGRRDGPCCDSPEYESTPARGLVHNHHPTVKPLALVEYLARLILPPKLDKPRRLLVPFCGSGSEIIGALRAGWDEIVGIDLEESYLEIAKARIDHYLKGAA